MTTSIPREHVLFVHAHPDDETIATGGTIATLLDAGSMVTLITCTRGERGEVIPPELQHLTGDALGTYRESELAAAMRELHLTDYRILGNDGARPDTVAPHRFADSGMQWGPDGAEPLARTAPAPASTPTPVPSHVTLSEADLDVLISDIAWVIDDVKPTAVVSYDRRGGYGHPDHLKSHEAAGIAAFSMGVPFFTIVADGRVADGRVADGRVADGHVVPSDTRIDVSAVMERKMRALAAYRTQLTVGGDTIVHSGGQVEPISTIEVFRRWAAPHAPSIEWNDLRWASRVTASVTAFLLGGVTGVVGTVHHGLAMSAISLLISTGFLVGLRLLFRSRVVAGFGALGLLLVVGIFSLQSPGGSVLIQSNEVGFIWSYAVPVVALIVLAWPSVGKRSRATMGKKSDQGKVVGAS